MRLRTKIGWGVAIWLAFLVLIAISNIKNKEKPEPTHTVAAGHQVKVCYDMSPGARKPNQWCREPGHGVKWAYLRYHVGVKDKRIPAVGQLLVNPSWEPWPDMPILENIPEEGAWWP
jgi:hypothetical protein